MYLTARVCLVCVHRTFRNGVPINRDFIAASLASLRSSMFSPGGACVFVADCNVGLQATGVFGYRLAGK